MKLRIKLAIMAFLPLAVFLFQAAIQSSQMLETMDISKTMLTNMKAFNSASYLIHELQKERGLSSLFSSGGNVRDDLTKQRTLTDDRISTFLSSIQESTLNERIKDSSVSSVKLVDETRNRVSPELLQ